MSVLAPVRFMKARLTGSYLSLRSGKNSDRILAYGRGRVCKASGCETVLSNYNPGHFCALHAATEALQASS